jgi:hypothetical protein
MIAPSYEHELEMAGRALARLLSSPEYSAGDREDGPGQRKAKEDMIMKLAADLGVSRERALQLVADAGQLRSVNGRPRSVVDQGKTVRPEPDLAYNAKVNGRNRRINIEIDANPDAAVKHMQQLTQADPNARHVAVIVDPVSGKPRDGMIWDPDKKRARSLTKAEIERWNRTGKPPASVAPPPNRRQVNRATPARTPRSAASVRKKMSAGVRAVNPPRKRRGARESELEFAAYELGAALGLGPERMDVDIPGIPGNNQWFGSPGEARRAALRDANRAGLGYRIAHDPRPSRGQPHYHVVGPDGTRVSGHYFYGSRMPRRVLRGRPNREGELDVAAREFEFAMQ